MNQLVTGYQLEIAERMLERENKVEMMLSVCVCVSVCEREGRVVFVCKVSEKLPASNRDYNSKCA